jgi:UDP-N-acetylglucosamine acyltransferase
MPNIIHSTAIIGAGVALGNGNEIGPYSILYGPLKIGDDNWIGPHVTIGTPGQDTRNPRYDSTNAKIEIGNHNIIREYTAIQKPCYRDITKIGNNVYIMQSVHVPHDAIIYDHVVITPMVVMAGIVNILEGATLSIGCSVHQYTVIGDYSIVAMGAAVTKNIKPFSRYIPGKPASVNEYAIKKYGFEELREEIYDYVLDNKVPSEFRLGKIIARYKNICSKYDRKSY